MSQAGAGTTECIQFSSMSMRGAHTRKGHAASVTLLRRERLRRRRGNLVQEVPSTYKSIAGDCHSQCAHWLRNDKKGSLLCHCEERRRRGNLVQELP